MPDPAPDRIRVLLVAAEASGGIGRHIRTLAEQLPRHGVEVLVCAPASTLAAIGLAPSRTVVSAPVGRPLTVPALRRSLRGLARAVDVVHAHGLRAGASAAACVPSAPLVVTWHNAGLLTGPAGIAQRALARYVAHSADLTLAASEDLAGQARRAGAIAVRSTFVVAPPLPAASRSRDAVRTELGIGDRPLVLAIGRLQAQKRFDVLVEAAAGWRDDPSGPLVMVAGSGPDHEALMARIAATGAPVRLLGDRADVSDLLAAADVVALPSAWEARSLVAQEALRAGVALVTTPVGGLPQLVGRAASLVPVGDPVALRAAIEHVLQDPEQRGRMIELGRARASTWPDEAEMIDQLRSTYLDLNHRSSLD